jgi:hypothetical protein
VCGVDYSTARAWVSNLGSWGAVLGCKGHGRPQLSVFSTCTRGSGFYIIPQCYRRGDSRRYGILRRLRFCFPNYVIWEAV